MYHRGGLRKGLCLALGALALICPAIAQTASPPKPANAPPEKQSDATTKKQSGTPQAKQPDNQQSTDATPPSARIVNPDSIDLTLRPDLSVTTNVMIQWDGGKTAPAVQFNLALGRDGSPCKSTVTNLLPNAALIKDHAVEIPIEIVGCSGGNADGKLGISSDPNNHTIAVHLHRAKSEWPTRALYGSLGLALVIALICAITAILHGHKLGDAIGVASWNFSTSWASNLTAFAGAFSFLLQFTVFPDKPVFGSRMEYTFLVAFAGALVAVAPAVQTLMGTTSIDSSSGTPVATSHGMVGGFITASGFTMWGAYLQVATTVLILCELRTTASLNEPMSTLVAAVVVLVGIGLAIYCWWTILTTIAANATRSGQKTANLQTFAAPAVNGVTAIAREVSVL